MKFNVFLAIVIALFFLHSKTYCQEMDCYAPMVTVISYDDNAEIKATIIRRDSFCDDLLVHKFSNIDSTTLIWKPGLAQMYESKNYSYDASGKLIKILTKRFLKDAETFKDTMGINYTKIESQIPEEIVLEEYQLNSVLNYLASDYKAHLFSDVSAFTFSIEVKGEEIKIRKIEKSKTDRFFSSLGYTCTVLSPDRLSVVEDELIRSGFRRGPKEVILEFNHLKKLAKFTGVTNHYQNSRVLITMSRGELLPS